MLGCVLIFGCKVGWILGWCVIGVIRDDVCFVDDGVVIDEMFVYGYCLLGY